MITKLSQSTIDPNTYGTSLTVTGLPGFGKTSTVRALCHHPVIKDQFTDGFAFIELGPQATDPSVKLSQLYHLLTGEYLKPGDINHAEQEINQLASHYCQNLLVIIDDVWHAEDAEPIVKAFSNCKIVLTTRMNDIEQYIPSKQVVSIGPMEQSEAISLLTHEVIDIGQLSQEDVSLLDELAQDVHLWPLLLSLIRGQLSHNLRHRSLSSHEAIHSVQAKLLHKGLTAFDKNNIEKSRKYAAKVCIEITLDSMTKRLSNKLKSLILFTGIGTSLQTEVLRDLWRVRQDEAVETADALWNYGLVQFAVIRLPPLNNACQCIEVHTVISHYIIENMESNEVKLLSPVGGLGTYESILDGLSFSILRPYGVRDVSSLSVMDYLRFRISMIENGALPFHLKQINAFTIYDPHFVIETLQHLQGCLPMLQFAPMVVNASPNIQTMLPSFCEQIKVLTSDCHRILKCTHKMSRKLGQSYEHCLAQQNYPRLIQVLEQYASSYPIADVAQKAITAVKKFITQCDLGPLPFFSGICELLQVMTSNYNLLTLNMLPRIKLQINLLQRINNSILAGSPDIEQMYDYIKSQKIVEEFDAVVTNWLMKLQEVAPNYVQQMTSQ